MRRGYPLVALLLGLGSTSSSRAAEPNPPGATPAVPTDKARAEALVLLREGNAKLDQGLYLEALERFERAERLFPSPVLAFNIAQTLNELGRTLEALERYEYFVGHARLEANPDFDRIAHQQIYKLSGRIGRIEVQVSVAEATVTLDGK